MIQINKTSRFETRSNSTPKAKKLKIADTDEIQKASETLTEELLFAENLENGIEIEFDDIKTKLTITK